MNKPTRRIAVLLAATVLLLSGCDHASNTDSLPPEPREETVETSENSFGARYNFTLGHITEKLADEIAYEVAVPVGADWKVLSTGLVDDNGVAYSSYCNHQGGITYTAAVEDVSGKVMNIGCGCLTEKTDDDEYLQQFLQIAATVAACAGGYKQDDAAYLRRIFRELMNSSETTYVFRGTLYIKSEYEGTTVLMTSPCSDLVISKNQYPEYTE